MNRNISRIFGLVGFHNPKNRPRSLVVSDSVIILVSDVRYSDTGYVCAGADDAGFMFICCSSAGVCISASNSHLQRDLLLALNAEHLHSRYLNHQNRITVCIVYERQLNKVLCRRSLSTENTVAAVTRCDIHR